MSRKQSLDRYDGFGVLLAILFLVACITSVGSVQVPWLSVGTITFGTIVAVSNDLRSRTIPNWLSYGGGIAILSLSSISAILGRNGWDSRWLCMPLSESLSGALVCFSAMFLLYQYSETGGGDVKLATVWGACLGVSSGMMIIVGCYLIAALAIPFLFLTRRLLRSSRKQDASMLPMAPFFSIASILYCLGLRLW